MSESQTTAADGLKALQAGDLDRAFSTLAAAVEAGESGAMTLFGLAFAARALSRHDDALSAIERLLELEPGHLEALIIKADALTALGDPRRAASFYMAAVNASQSAGKIDARLAQEIERARKECAAAAVDYEEFLRDRINQLGVFDGSGHRRGEQALDILFGRKQIFFQQPTNFYFPELPQTQFYDPSEFAWVKDLIAQTGNIRRELEAVLNSGGGFVPYVPEDNKTPHPPGVKVSGNTDWTAFHMFKDGVRVQENAERCPQTMKALEQTPMPNVAGKSPIALFSCLKPSFHIPPHTGLTNTRLICHLPLIAPEGCVLRVGNQERSWREGEVLIFDDSIEHEAHNHSSSERIILLFDMWRPEISAGERVFIETIFAGIEEFGVF